MAGFGRWLDAVKSNWTLRKWQATSSGRIHIAPRKIERPIANVYAASRVGKVLNKTKSGDAGLYMVENLLSGEHK
jgi:hypothetical protein